MKRKWYEDVAIVVGVIVLLGLLTAVTAVCTGFVGMKMWNWFVPLTFHHAPTLSIGRAIGLSLVFSVFRGAPKVENAEDKKVSYGVRVANTFVRLGLVLFVGWAVHSIIT